MVIFNSYVKLPEGKSWWIYKWHISRYGIYKWHMFHRYDILQGTSNQFRSLGWSVAEQCSSELLWVRNEPPLALAKTLDRRSGLKMRTVQFQRIITRPPCFGIVTKHGVWLLHYYHVSSFFLPLVWTNPVVWGWKDNLKSPLVNGVWIHHEKLIHARPCCICI